MKKLVPLILAGLFMAALIASPLSEKICYAQDAIEPIAATVDIRPNTINLERNGNFVMGLIKLPEGYSIENIDLTSIAVIKTNGVLLDPSIPADWAFIDEEIMDSVIAKFPNKTFKDALPVDLVYPANVEISVSGTLTDDAKTPFEGTDQVRVIKPGKGAGKIKDIFGRWGMALEAPQNLTCQIVDNNVCFDWDDVAGAAKYSIDVEVPVYAEDPEVPVMVVELSFSTGDRTDEGLMGDSSLCVPISEFVYDTNGDGTPEQLSGEGTAKVKALAPGRMNGRQNNPFSDECTFILP